MYGVFSYILLEFKFFASFGAFLPVQIFAEMQNWNLPTDVTKTIRVLFWYFLRKSSLYHPSPTTYTTAPNAVSFSISKHSLHW